MLQNMVSNQSEKEWWYAIKSMLYSLFCPRDDDDDDDKANIYVQLNFAHFFSFVHVRLQQMLIDIYQVEFLCHLQHQSPVFLLKRSY